VTDDEALDAWSTTLLFMRHSIAKGKCREFADRSAKLLFPEVDGRAALAKGLSGRLSPIFTEEFEHSYSVFNLLTFRVVQNVVDLLHAPTRIPWHHLPESPVCFRTFAVAHKFIIINLTFIMAFYMILPVRTERSPEAGVDIE